MNDARVQLVIVNLETVKLENTSMVLVFIYISVRTAGKHGLDFVKGWYTLDTKKVTGRNAIGKQHKSSDDSTPRVTSKDARIDLIHAIWREMGVYTPFWAAQEATDRILSRMWIAGYKIVPLEKSDLQ